MQTRIKAQRAAQNEVANFCRNGYAFVRGAQGKNAGYYIVRHRLLNRELVVNWRCEPLPCVEVVRGTRVVKVDYL